VTTIGPGTPSSTGGCGASTVTLKVDALVEWPYASNALHVTVDVEGKLTGAPPWGGNVVLGAGEQVTVGASEVGGMKKTHAPAELVAVTTMSSGIVENPGPVTVPVASQEAAEPIAGVRICSGSANEARNESTTVGSSESAVISN
jgi:hypothetical protein